MLAGNVNRWTSIQREREKEREREMARVRDHSRQIQNTKPTGWNTSANAPGVDAYNESTYSHASLTANSHESNTTLTPTSGLTREIRKNTLEKGKSSPSPLPSSPSNSPRETQERSYNRGNMGNSKKISSQQSLQSIRSDHSNPDSLQNLREKDDVHTFISIYRRKYAVNPFWRDTGADVLGLRTHNRRRWSHVFPSGQNSSVLSNYYGLNWKSLTQPAILPLFTDYIPSVDNIYKGTTQMLCLSLIHLILVT